MEEIWRDIFGYVGYYQVSDWGMVRSLDRVVPRKNGTMMKLKGRILRFNLNNGGYRMVVLSKNRVQTIVAVHQFVAVAFIGPCPEGQQVRHGPNGQWDNSVYNLCYGTPRANQLDRVRDGTHSGRSVRRSDGKEYRSLVEAARDSGCWAGDIGKVCKGRGKTSGGFGWEYV